MYDYLGEREVVIVRELTKKFEEINYSRLGQIEAEDLKLKGEFVIVVAGLGKNKKKLTDKR